MVKPKKCRLVSSLPGLTYFKPAGIPLGLLSEIKLSVEEAEALRLKEIENLDQAHAALRMGISRPTFQRILSSARRKLADAILSGKTVRIDGGNFTLANSSIVSRSRFQSLYTSAVEPTDEAPG